MSRINSRSIPDDLLNGIQRFIAYFAGDPLDIDVVFTTNNKELLRRISLQVGSLLKRFFKVKIINYAFELVDSKFLDKNLYGVTNRKTEVKFWPLFFHNDNDVTEYMFSILSPYLNDYLCFVLNNLIVNYKIGIKFSLADNCINIIKDN